MLGYRIEYYLISRGGCVTSVNNKNLTPEKKETERQREKGKREIYKIKNLLAEKLAAKRGKK